MADSGIYGRPARRLGERTWEEVAIPVIEHEDRLASDAAAEIWSKIYRCFDAGNESLQREVKLAVYAYYAVNGASRRTKHTRDINTGGGVSVLAADVGDVIGLMQIRQFLRADVDEAYSALKETEVLEKDEVFVHKAMEKGIPRGYMHCAVDFLRGCSLMTPEESSYADRHFSFSIQRARGARGGVTVDEEDGRNRMMSLSNQKEVGRVSNGHHEVDEF